MTDRCPTCGSAVAVVSGDEGTSHYEPLRYGQAVKALTADYEGAIEERDRLRIEVERLRGIIERRGTVEALAQLDPRRGQSAQSDAQSQTGSQA